MTSNPTSVYISKKNKSKISMMYIYSMFITALFMMVKIWKQPKFPLTNEWMKMWYMRIMEYISAICNNINESLGHFAR